MKLLSEHDFMFCLAGQIYDQSPNRQPRKAHEILMKARDSFRQRATNLNEFYYWEIPLDTTEDIEILDKTLQEMLFAIEEFEEMNLSQIEYDNGVKVSDESRPRFGFTSAYDVYNNESWKHDFVDLDAFIRNLLHELVHRINKSEEECSSGGESDEKTIK